jgi:hypothetical protein
MPSRCTLQAPEREFRIPCIPTTDLPSDAPVSWTVFFQCSNADFCLKTGAAISPRSILRPIKMVRTWRDFSTGTNVAERSALAAVGCRPPLRRHTEPTGEARGGVQLPTVPAGILFAKRDGPSFDLDRIQTGRFAKAWIFSEPATTRT